MTHSQDVDNIWEGTFYQAISYTLNQNIRATLCEELVTDPNSRWFLEQSTGPGKPTLSNEFTLCKFETIATQYGMKKTRLYKLSQEFEVKQLTMLGALFHLQELNLESIEIFSGESWKRYSINQFGELVFETEPGFPVTSGFSLADKRKFPCRVPLPDLGWRPLTKGEVLTYV